MTPTLSTLGSDDDGPSSSGSHAKTMLARDGDYYMEGWFVTFEVEGRLFRVPSYQFFRESPGFVDVFKLSLHGMDGDDPITLRDVGHDDFKSLLKALYPQSVSLQLSLSKPEWLSVLTLSSEWRFLRLREMAISELGRLGWLTSVEKICLGRELNISSWVTAGFEELVKRSDPITDNEAIDIDSNYVTTVYKLFRIRELRLGGKPFSPSAKINEIFKDELERIVREEQTFKVQDTEDAKLLAEKEEKSKAAEEMKWREEKMEEERRIEEELLKKEEEEKLRADEERRSALSMQLKESRGGTAPKKRTIKR